MYRQTNRSDTRYNCHLAALLLPKHMVCCCGVCDVVAHKARRMAVLGFLSMYPPVGHGQVWSTAVLCAGDGCGSGPLPGCGFVFALCIMPWQQR
jgi:hypothetical protein